ncbi:ImuA family protein [Brevundimonas goettingensis]|uniref:Damage-inducible protein n=1 Tax=Brevundimonas goettingensis TaxID=2774190 RepID=A0A975C2W3_9CAUL|nr:ImuA family protein [Brevundimonas goettingensis]QTC92863.1 damage-inducible protein [Brevundimonas goettingensis]
MSVAPPTSAFETLRKDIARLEAGGRAPGGVLPFGVPDIDARLPAGGLQLGALHEVAGGGNGALHGTASALFVAGVAARTRGPVLWCVTRADLFAPALEQAGLESNRVVYVEAEDEAAVLTAFEEGLRHGGLGAVVGEVARLSMTASRRLQLAAEGSGTLGLAIRRWRRQAEAADFGQPTAAVTRWRVTALPSTPLPSKPLPVAGVGRARWFVELIRCRAGACADFELEACDETGRLALPADLADRSSSTPAWDRRAVA